MRALTLGLALAAGLGTALAGRAALAQEGEIVDHPKFPPVDAQKGPQETFELNTLSVIHVGDLGWRANRGKYRESMTRSDFYITVGRPDLAAQDRHAATVSVTLNWLGIGAVAAGGVLTFAYLSPGGFQPPVWLGLGLLGGGALSIFIGSKVDGPAVTSDEADGLARRYNELLKAHIDREIETPRPVQTQVRLLSPRIVPWTDGRGGGLIALASF